MKLRILIILFFTLNIFANTEQIQRFSAKTKLLYPNSPQFHSINHIPLEMAQFYLALGVSEYWHCAQNDDPLSCSEYLQMMSDPISHLGFVFFMVASRQVTELGLKSKITAPLANYLGLASGMLVQTVFEEIYRHPDMQIFLKSRYIEDEKERNEVRKKALQRLYDKTFNDQEWYLQKFPLISSLLLAAGFSPLIVKSTYTISSSSYSLLKKIFGPTKFKKLDSFFSTQKNGLNKLKRRISVKGVKIVLNKGKTTKLAPIIYAGEYLIGTITFLELHHIIDDYISEFWREYRSKKLVKKEIENLEKELSKNQEDKKKILLKIQSLKELWDNYRLAISEKAFSAYARHIGDLNQMESSSENVFFYYTWLGRGMNSEDPEWLENKNDWHAPLYDLFSFDSTVQENIKIEQDHYIYQLFCGKPLKESIEFTLDYSGIPIPFAKFTLDEYKKIRSRIGDEFKLKSYNLQPYKIIDYPYTCEKDLKRLDGKPIVIFSTNHNSNVARFDMNLEYLCPIHLNENNFLLKEKPMSKRSCLYTLDLYRKYLLKNAIDKNKLLSKIYDDFSIKIPDFLKMFKTQKLRRYENALQEDLEDALGKNMDAFHFSYELRSSVLDSYKNELLYWSQLNNKYPKFKDVLNEIIQITTKEHEAAKSLKVYIGKNVNARDPDQYHDENPFEEKSTWENFWKEIIIH